MAFEQAICVDEGGKIKLYADKMRFFALKDFERNGYVGIQTFSTIGGKEHFLRNMKQYSGLLF